MLHVEVMCYVWKRMFTFLLKPPVLLRSIVERNPLWTPVVEPFHVHINILRGSTIYPFLSVFPPQLLYQ